MSTRFFTESEVAELRTSGCNIRTRWRTGCAGGRVALASPYAPTFSETFEKHYRVSELAELWGLGRETVRLLVKDEPGVIRIRLGRKKTHTTYSVPESTAKRIHTRLLYP
jgi:hypothetical protein